jgi:hypothetical protein
MTDTRREMTRAQFEEAAAYAYDNWWLTGEDAFVHVPSVMNVEGWNFYGHPGQSQLTEPQRVLMMWSDLVGQTSNGGFIQFVDNFSASLALAYRLVTKLEWPELIERFDRAFREQVGDPENPKPRQEPWGPDDDKAWAYYHERKIRELARINTRWRPWARQREMATLKRFPDGILSSWYDAAVNRGDISAADEFEANYGSAGGIKFKISPSRDDEPTEAADAFDDWFHLGETKAASKIFIGEYIIRHRDELCRLTD